MTPPKLKLIAMIWSKELNGVKSLHMFMYLQIWFGMDYVENNIMLLHPII
jgi:hypothetical protein